MNDGILIVNKPKGLTSHDVIYKIRKLFGTRQVGHTGTLDPMATGVLCVLVGRAVKASEYLVCHDKKYTAGLKLGLTTDTEDADGTIISSIPEGSALPDQNEVYQAAKRFEGKIMQVPPMYSALKRDGVKLANLARKGIVVDREARPIEIYSLDITPENPGNGEYILSVHCSKGTYIRSLCSDIGNALGCGGIMSSLVRNESGGFRLEDSFTIDQLAEMSLEERFSCLIETEKLFESCPVLSLSEFPAHLSHNGAELYLDRNLQDIISSKLEESELEVGKRLRLYDSKGFYGIGDVTEYPDGTAIKTVKLFRL